MRRIHLKISGRVQGVFFRANAQKKALELGLAGWVRNTSDGGVETAAEGDDAAIEKFISWCRRGPEHAQVANVEEKEEKPTNEFRNFEIRYF